MPSSAHNVLSQALQEVTELLRADPTPRGQIPPDPDLTRAITRSSVVILTSHFERYIRSVNEEAVGLLNVSLPLGQLLTERFRLQHSRVIVETMADAQWTNRADMLRSFASEDAWLWGGTNKGTLQHERIIQWMKSPLPKNIIRFYGLWGFEDIFTSITRKRHTRRQLEFKLTELVEKRNNIAHGDFSTEATADEVREYMSLVAIFCDRVDRQLARKLRESLNVICQWY